MKSIIKYLPRNEAPHRPDKPGFPLRFNKRWGIKRNYGVANPASLYRASPWFASPFIPAAPHKAAGSPLRYDKPQGILAKTNKRSLSDAANCPYRPVFIYNKYIKPDGTWSDFFRSNESQDDLKKVYIIIPKQVYVNHLQEDVYLRGLVRYIHLNPVRGGIISTLTELAGLLDISLPAVCYSVERGETIAHNNYQLIN